MSIKFTDFERWDRIKGLLFCDLEYVVHESERIKHFCWSFGGKVRRGMRLEAARSIFLAAVQGADPLVSVNKFLNSPGGKLGLERFENVVVCGAGKASAQMAKAALTQLKEELGNKKVIGQVLTKYGHAVDATKRDLEAFNVKVSEAGHPVPDQAGVLATEEVLRLAKDFASDKTLVLNFVSGGGSSLTCLPVPGLSLEDLQDTVSLLLGCGATIEEINTVRRHLTMYQGGRLAAAFYPSTVISMILSDVIGDPLHVIAGGPTAPDPTTFEDCKGVLTDKTFNIYARLPTSVQNFLERSDLQDWETKKPGDHCFLRVRNHVISSNRLALGAAKEKAESLGYSVQILSDSIAGEARQVAKVLCAIAKSSWSATGLCIPSKNDAPLALLTGGETTVSLEGAEENSVGGRNQEMALAAALEIVQDPKITFLAAGTDGQDGPCDAAGAVVNSTLCSDRDSVLEAKKYLARHDAYNFFQSSEEKKKFHILTGPTGTNVMDICVILIDRQ